MITDKLGFIMKEGHNRDKVFGAIDYGIKNPLSGFCNHTLSVTSFSYTTNGNRLGINITANSKLNTVSLGIGDKINDSNIRKRINAHNQAEHDNDSKQIEKTNKNLPKELQLSHKK